ncbi:MAG: phosphoribosylamine--glycine ligase [Acidimicrobiales bacterium]|nr:phosphoribosylamine--glycine ligase [Acidimicrobiales bacterium]
MKVVVVGSGAREHALAVALARTAEVVATPGSPGIAAVAECVDTDATELDADLFVIGPEAPLVDGLADRLRAQGKLVFGPNADGALLEGSKAYLKRVIVEAGVPTARYATFTEVDAAVAYLKDSTGPYVIKTDGLAAGKGVLVTDSLDEAIADATDKLSGATFAGAGTTVVIEECMTGPELSVLAVCDGSNYVLLPAAQDFKRMFDGDVGPNTGGMGAYTPVPKVDVDELKIGPTFIQPTLDYLTAQGIDYRGVLYAGLMLTPVGPKLVEFNVRFGDPEAEAVLPGLQGDVAALLASAADGQVDGSHIAGGAQGSVTASVTVMIASDAPAGGVIIGVETANAIDGVDVLHARTKAEKGALVTAGSGRILAVTGRAPTLREARELAYAGVKEIDLPGGYYRTDIAAKAVEESEK